MTTWSELTNYYSPRAINYAAMGVATVTAALASRNVRDTVLNVAKTVLRNVPTSPSGVVLGVVVIGIGVSVYTFPQVYIELGKDVFQGTINYLDKRNKQIIAKEGEKQAKKDAEKLKIETKENKARVADCGNRTQKLEEHNIEEKKKFKDLHKKADDLEKQLKIIENKKNTDSPRSGSA